MKRPLPSDYKELLEARGLSLEDLGLREIALRRDDALLAVQMLRRASVPILGGDVYLQTGDGIEVAYDNWSSNSRFGEERHSYFTRSWDETEAYVRRYPQPRSAQIPLFVLVVGG